MTPERQMSEGNTTSRSRDRAEVHCSNGRTEEAPKEGIADFISEDRNPGNSKHVGTARVEWPSPARFRNVRLSDTPGLENVLKRGLF